MINPLRAAKELAASILNEKKERAKKNPKVWDDFVALVESIDNHKILSFIIMEMYTKFDSDNLEGLTQLVNETKFAKEVLDIIRQDPELVKD